MLLAIQELKKYKKEMIDQFNFINNKYSIQEQDAETKATSEKIALRIDCLEKTIKRLRSKV